MMERIAALGADYVSTIGALARTEAAQDVARLGAAARGSVIAAAVLALGALWLNVGVLLWLLTTPYPVLGAFVIGAVALAIGATMSASARRGVKSLRLLEGTRRVLADELGARDPDAPSAPAPPLHPAEASARLRAIREALRDTVALHRGPPGEPGEAPATAGFEPRSRTMRTALWLWRAIGRVPQGTAMAGALGMLALGSPRLRRLLAVIALLRNLGAHPRAHAGSGHGTSPYASP